MLLRYLSPLKSKYMMTKLDENKFKDNPQQINDERFTDFRDVANIRVLRRNGFFGVTLPVMHVLPGATAETSANWSAPFFRANRTYQVVECYVRYEEAATNVDTLDLVKVASGVAPASGTSILTAKVNITTTKNTDIKASISTTPGVAIIPAGTCLAIIPKNSPATLDLRGLTVYVLLKAI